MNNFPKLILRNKKEAPLKRFHHWVFSGAVKKTEGHPENGDVVEVYSIRNEYLGTGHYHDGNICVRIFSFTKVNPDQQFWTEKLQKAYNLRKLDQLTSNNSTNAFRLVHGEGDLLPGLIIDFYNGTCVIQAHSVGIHKIRAQITEGLKTVFGDQLKAVYYKSQRTIPSDFDGEVEDGYLFGTPETETILENDHTFYVNWEEGQKTGFFLDQRDNRKLLARFVKGKSVLNTFCYSGGFSIYALKAGAKLVHSVDSSAKAIEWTNKNVALNGLETNHEAYVDDVLKFLKASKQKYEVVILDPPAYAKNIRSKHKAIIGYKRLNMEGIAHMPPNSILFTFSCSQVISQDIFKSTILAAAIEVKRKVRILYSLSQPADHPINIFHPEVSYLKGLVLHVE